MIISENIYANVSLFGLVRMNRCLPRQADCVLLRNSEWFRREDEATTRFSLLSDTVRIPSCTLVHTLVHSRVSTLFQCQSSWNAPIVYRTQAILGSFFFFEGRRSKCERVRLPTLLATLKLFHKSLVLYAKDEDASCVWGGKRVKRFRSTMSVCKIVYALVWCLFFCIL